MRLERGDKLTETQIQASVDSILALEEDTQDMIDSINRATAAGWVNFYPSRRKKQKTQQPKPAKGRDPRSFSNFEQRNYDYDDLTTRLIMAGMQEDSSNDDVRSG